MKTYSNPYTINRDSLDLAELALEIIYQTDTTTTTPTTPTTTTNHNHNKCYL